MHHTYFFLRPLSAQLNLQLSGFTLVSCFTQNKDELIIELNNSRESFFVKASLTAEFCCLSFPHQFSRARKNSLDLFPDLILKKVTKVWVVSNERSMVVDLENDWQIVFKMHGLRSNVLVFHQGKAIGIFRHHLRADLEVTLNDLSKELDWSREWFEKHRSNLAKTYFTLGAVPFAYLAIQNFDTSPTELQWVLWQQMLQQLNNPKFYLCLWRENYHLTLLPVGSVEKEFTEPIEALNEFFSIYVQHVALARGKTEATRTLERQLKSVMALLARNKAKLEELTNDRHWQQWGDLVMANLHRVAQGATHLEVEDFYHDQQKIVIPLKRELNGQANAEVFYRKGKNQHIEIAKLAESIAQAEKKKRQLEDEMSRTNSVESLVEWNNTSKSRQKPTENRPFHEFIFKGYKIWVGKDATSNDELTLKYSFKDDLWLHAKDSPGSHVLIKHQAGKNFPKDVIERAGELAAYNSKRKNETLCPVSVTPKKFVRKRKGDPPGAVVVEKETVILVEPRL